jgi:hypothetical protein
MIFPELKEWDSGGMDWIDKKSFQVWAKALADKLRGDYLRKEETPQNVFEVWNELLRVSKL